MNIAKIEDADVRMLVQDTIREFGEQETVKFMQLAAHIFPSGHFDRSTEEVVNRMTPRALYLGICARRLRHVGALIVKEPAHAARAVEHCEKLASLIQMV